MHLHTHFPTGAHIFVIMRSGYKFDDHWKPCDRRGHICLRKAGFIPLEKIRNLSYYRNPTSETSHLKDPHAPLRLHRNTPPMG
jgi:hypothetical protein